MSPHLPRHSYVKLQRLCKRWGGKIQLLNYTDFDRYVTANTSHLNRESDGEPITSLAPAARWHGMCWATRTIYAVDLEANAGAIIHEMGHTFLDLDEDQVDNSDEVSWLGWEIAVARYAGCYRIWSDQNAGYNLGDDVCDEDGSFEWGSITPKFEREVIVDRLKHARRVGYLDRRFRPRSTRPMSDPSATARV